MQRIKLIDKFNGVHYWDKNDDEADLFREELWSTNKYGSPHEIIITQTERSSFEMERPLYECREDIDKHAPVYYCGSTSTQEIRRVHPVLDNIHNTFNAQIVESCEISERTVLTAYTDAETGFLYLIAGLCREQVEWSREFLVEETQPGCFHIAPFDGRERFILIMPRGEDNAGYACIGTFDEGDFILGPWTRFSERALCTDMTCLNIDTRTFIAVSYKDGHDNLGYTRIGLVDGGTNAISWESPWNHGISESFENRLCSLGWGESKKYFGVFYRRAVGAYKGFVKTASYNIEGGGFSVESNEVTCVNAFCKNMRPVLVTEEENVKIAMAYIDNDSGGNGMVCIGNMSDITNPSFNPVHAAVVNPGLTSSLSISANPHTMNNTFYMTWIDCLKGNRCEFGHYYYENDIPKSNVGERVIDYWPAINTNIIGFSYVGYMDIFVLFTIDKGLDKFASYDLVTGEDGLGYFNSIGGFASENGSEGDFIQVSLFGDVVDYSNANHNTVLYLERDGKYTGIPTPFPVILGLNMHQIQYTKTGAIS